MVRLHSSIKANLDPGNGSSEGLDPSSLQEKAKVKSFTSCLPGHLLPHSAGRLGHSQKELAKGGCYISVRNLSYSVKPQLSWDLLFSESPALPCSPPEEHSLGNVEPPSAVGPPPPWKLKKILRTVDFEVGPGEVLAIVGPSGAGKSTVLDVLAGRIPRRKLQGQVRMQAGGGRAGVLVSEGCRVGFVPQDDNLHAVLTPRESLMFSASMRLPSSTPHAEKVNSVNSVLRELSLHAVADRQIGTEEHGGVRGLSGGERRRVSIGVELVHDPSLLLLDEPTTGLDSQTALNAVQLLKRMAEMGQRTIVLSIHQPSTRILLQMSSLLLMAKGAVVYHGPTLGLECAITAAGYEIPARASSLEYGMDLITQYTHNPKRLREMLMPAVHLRNQGTAGGENGCSHPTLPTEVVDSALTTGTLGCARPAGTEVQEDERESGSQECESDSESGGAREGWQLCEEGSGRVEEKGQGRCLGCAGDEGGKGSQYVNSSWVEVATLCQRNVQVVVRSREMWLCRSLGAIGSGIILGSVFSRVGDGLADVKDRVGFLISVVGFIYSSTMEPIPVLLKERHMLRREALSKTYRVSSYLVASCLTWLPYLLWLAFCLCTPAYWLAGFHASAIKYFTFVLVCWVCYWSATAAVSFATALFPDFLSAMSLTLGMFRLFLLFSGYFITRANIPEYWRWMYYLSLHKYPLNALLMNEYDSAEEPSLVTRFLDLEKASMWTQLLILLGFAAAYWVLCYASLCFRLRLRR